jgi:hypothetical protein
VLQLAIKGAPHSSSKHRETTDHCCCCVLLHFLRESLRAQNSRKQTSETSSSCDTCTGRRAIKCLGSTTLRDCSLVRVTTSWWCKLLYHYFQKVVRGTALIPFFLHQIRIDYFKLLNISTVGNGTIGASGTGPASGYNLVLSNLFIMFFLLLYRLSANTSNPYTVIILLIFTHSMIYFIIFKIKIYRKMTKTLTVVPSTFRDGDGTLSRFLISIKYNIPTSTMMHVQLLDDSNKLVLASLQLALYSYTGRWL